ncbi:hypothetical protein [Candidatus Magnetominusculus dajiuhuensis]|uniref:hypothetical protein n=1 Tax=Candidatus Magnetominusculus dajiuhuensis TaxID=3137712 RepID=UPI003B42A2EE
MITKNMKSFMNMASTFVEKNKSGWDHEAWLGFISDVQKNGMEMCDDTKACAGAVLEAMQKYSKTAMGVSGMASKMADVTDLTVKFLKDTKGVWSHPEWEAYIKSMQEKGMKVSEEAKAYLGSLLEASKQLASSTSMR